MNPLISHTAFSSVSVYRNPIHFITTIIFHQSLHPNLCIRICFAKKHIL